MQFPWSAVVGQEALKRALMLCAIDPAIGGVLVSGPRGVAKTTLARALAELVPGQFVELPLGATEERVTGAIDLERALQEGRVQFAPGLLARAHEGVLYVDEVNLLPDALVDLLLDAAATGRNVVERDGVSHAHPARFVLVGSMNPEEGELRPQLIDRFGLSVSAEAAIPPAERAEIVMRRLAFDRDPEAFRAKYAAEQQAVVERCRRARELAAKIELGGAALARVTERCHAAGVEGVRADLAMLRAARAHAAWSGRAEITSEDVDAVAELALAHRRPRGGDPQAGRGGGGRPGGGGHSPEPVQQSAAEGGRQSPAQRRTALAMDTESNRNARRSAEQAAASSVDGLDAARDAPQVGLPQSSGESGDKPGSRSAMAARPVRAVQLSDLPRWLTKATGKSPAGYRRGGARAAASTGSRGRATRAGATLDWFATLSRAARSSAARTGEGAAADLARAAARGGLAGVLARGAAARDGSADVLARGAATRDGLAGGLPLAAATPTSPPTFRAARGARVHVSRDQIRYRSRRAPSSQLWILAVDCSSSMLRSGGLALAKGFAHSIEFGARRAGARLAVISFRGAGAQLEVDSSPGRAVLPAAIAALGGGGGTPLRAALVAAGSLCKQTRWRNPGVFRRLLVLTDGRVRDLTSSIPPLPSDLDRVVVDCELGRVRLGRTQQLTAALHASYYRPAQA
jgi:magnesium chelatase subunit I